MIRLCFLIIIASFLSSCVSGAIYHNVTEPLDVNMNNTLRGEAIGQSSTIQLREPVTAARIATEWDSRGVGDAMKRSQLRKAYYADLQTTSFFSEVWKRQRIKVWGEKAKADSDS